MRYLGIACLMLSLSLGCTEKESARENELMLKTTRSKVPEEIPPPKVVEQKVVETEKDEAGSVGKEVAEVEAKEDKGNQVVVLETSKGKIVIRLFDEDAPKHCESFRTLAGKGFYDGTYFHRVVDGFVIQGGDPNTKDDDETNDGTGGPGYTVPNEANRNRHLRGRVAAARGQHPDSAGCQFYVCLRELPSLDQQHYTVFGEVIEGMDVVDKIVSVRKKRQASGEMSFPLDKTYIDKAYLSGFPLPQE